MDVVHAILFSKEMDISKIPVDYWSAKFELIRGGIECYYSLVYLIFDPSKMKLY